MSLCLVVSGCGSDASPTPGGSDAAADALTGADGSTKDVTDTDGNPNDLPPPDAPPNDALDAGTGTDGPATGDTVDTGDMGDMGDTGDDAPSPQPDAATDTASDTTDSPGKITRAEDPVVVLGAQLTALSSVAAEDVVAFRRDGGQWVHIPVQVDERAVKDFCAIYGKGSGLWTNAPACKTDAVITALFYTDAETFTGPDPDPFVDADDEVVFMARDAGDRIATWTEPADVVSGSGIEVELTDGDASAYVYLFARAGQALQPGAGANYVTYDFKLKDGVDYTQNYDLYGYSCGGFTATCNPSMTEDSTVDGASYSRHFSARWVTDALRITAGDATGVDILDIHQNRFGPESCGRHVLTFSTAEGAYVTNKSGPVRALRSYLGANSGPLTQRDHMFYDRREDIVTHLRVHAIPVGIMDVFDYSPQAIGMTYTNDLNPGGLTIDGVADDANEDGLHQWEFVTGPQGSLVMTGTFVSSLELQGARFFWADDTQASFDQCSTSTIIDAPDDSALGTSGVWLEGALPNTDPKNGVSDHILATRTIYYREPGLSLDGALELVAGAQLPVQVIARAVADSGLGEACGDGLCAAGEASSCALDCLPVDGTCGDTLCLPPEDSVNCPADCPADNSGVSVCGDGACTAPIENKLSCAEDCWPGYAPTIACVDVSCEGLLDACADEPGCVALVSCVGPCVAGGGGPSQCISDCQTSLMSSDADAETATQLLLCGQSAQCF